MALVGVSRTANDALMCKNSAGRINGMHVQTPLLNQFYSLRMQVLHRIVQETLLNHAHIDEYYQFIVLGCGLDTSYVDYLCRRLDETDQSRPVQDIRVFEVDQLDIISRRTSSSSIHLKHNLIACDLNDVDTLFQLLREQSFNFDAPSVFLAESVFAYIPSKSIDRLLVEISRLKSALLIVFDPLLSHRGLDLIMRRKFEERGAPLRSCLESTSQWLELLQDHHHWKHASVLLMTNAIHCFGVIKTCRREEFDEYASLAHLLRRYIVIVSATSSTMKSLLSTRPMIWSDRSYDNTEAKVIDDFLKRVSSAETRLESLIVKARINLPLPSLTFLCSRPSDATSVIELYTDSFKCVIEKYPSVKKFIKSSLTKLRSSLSTPSNDFVPICCVRDHRNIVGFVSLTIKV